MKIKISKAISKVVEHPRVLIGKLKGIPPCHSSSCFLAKDLLGKPAKTVIDIGAHHGLFIAASKYVFPRAKIYAFEPIKKLYNKLKNIENVTAFNFGLWDSEKEDIFYQNTENTGASSFLKPTEQYLKDVVSKDKLLETRAIKKRFDKLGIHIERPCFVKIDVEGAEERVLKGFGKALNNVDIIQIEVFFKEFHDNQMKLSKLLPFLEKHGFVGFIQKELSYIGNVPRACDLIFFR